VECFAEIDDPRIERTRVHPLESILVLAVLAVLAGAEGWEDIEDYGLEKGERSTKCILPGVLDSRVLFGLTQESSYVWWNA
jgi:hypothetical protein